MEKLFAVALLVLSFVGCTPVVSKVVDVAGNDLEVTSAMAKKYGKTAVAECADFMLKKAREVQAGSEALEALRDEPTAGLFSAALKAALIADALKQLEATNGPEFQQEFKSACSTVAGDVLFNIMQDAARVGRR